jgi:hypothetical protein
MSDIITTNDETAFYNILIGEKVTSFEDMKGRTLSKIVYNDEDEIRFHLTDTHYVLMFHEQDCCESVYVEDIVGDLDDLVGSPLLLVEEVSNYEPSNADDAEEEEDEYDYSDESETWTYYRLATAKGDVSIRWYGSSNGYYSESIDITVMGELK